MTGIPAKCTAPEFNVLFYRQLRQYKNVTKYMYLDTVNSLNKMEQQNNTCGAEWSLEVTESKLQSVTVVACII